MAISNGSNQDILTSGAELPEAEIVKRAQAGDADAFGELYQRHMDAIFRYVQNRVTETDEAENLTQIVFVKAWQGLARYQPTKTPFRGWLYRIAGNTVIDYYRTRKETADIETQWDLADDLPSPEEVLLSAERSESVRSAITHLKPSYQQVLSLRFLDERDYPETAQVLDRQVNAVRVLQHRALGALQKVLTQEQISWIVAVTAVLTLALGGSIALAAEGSLPGDTLYPLKRGAESSLLRLADDGLDVRLHQTFANRRVDEMARLLAAGRHDDVVAPSQAYAEHLSAIVSGLSLLAEQEPGEARHLADSAVQALALHDEKLSDLVSAEESVEKSALIQGIEAARQAKGILGAMAPESQPEPPPDTSRSGAESEMPAPVRSNRAPIKDTAPSQQSTVSMPEVSMPEVPMSEVPMSEVPMSAPPSSTTQNPHTDSSAAQAGPRSGTTTAPFQQRPANPADPTVANEGDPANESDAVSGERPQEQTSGPAEPNRANPARVEERVILRPIAWPFPTLRVEPFHPAAPLGAPQVLPHRNQPADPPRPPKSTDADQVPDPQPKPAGRPASQASADAVPARPPQPTQPPVPGSGEPAQSSPADDSKQVDQAQTPPVPNGEESNGSHPTSDSASEQPENQQGSHQERSPDSSNDDGNGQSGSPSGTGQGAQPSSPAGDPDTGTGNGTSGSAEQEEPSSSSSGQGRP